MIDRDETEVDSVNLKADYCSWRSLGPGGLPYNVLISALAAERPDALRLAVISAGRGERHPLCGMPLLGLPSTYLLPYAPRDEAELEVIEVLLRRAIAWIDAAPL